MITLLPYMWVHSSISSAHYSTPLSHMFTILPYVFTCLTLVPIYLQFVCALSARLLPLLSHIFTLTKLNTWGELFSCCSAYSSILFSSVLIQDLNTRELNLFLKMLYIWIFLLKFLTVLKITITMQWVQYYIYSCTLSYNLQLFF